MFVSVGECSFNGWRFANHPCIPNGTKKLQITMVCKQVEPYKVDPHQLYFGLSPLRVTVTTRIITFLVGHPYKPSFATVTGRGDNPSYIR